MSSYGFMPGGAHGGPAEKPFADEQLPLRLNDTRYWLGGRLEPETNIVIPSPRSITRTLPLVAEPRPRSSATNPAAASAYDAGSSRSLSVHRHGPPEDVPAATADTVDSGSA